MPAPDAILKLVQLFKNNADDYRKATFNEDQTRVQFINPMWKALGWDIDNTQGYAEDYKDVFHTKAMKLGGSSRAPDYSFGIGPTRKFFLEAKRPGVNLDAEKDPAHQLRNYAYTKGFALSVLTNFRQLAVYDGKIPLELADEPSHARLKFWSYEQFEEHWDEIEALLSRDAILTGAFDRFAASKSRRGTKPVDVLFLKDIEGWRLSLAQEIAAKNSISAEDLNQSVGRIIDRIIFLRICEETGVEPGQPLNALRNGFNTYARLVELFRVADARYNSGLFHFDSSSKRREIADEITPSLVISNSKIKNILERLYYPNPYAFDSLPLDILGQIYERFLGKVIVLDGKKADVQDKPEVRKAGGVYYTPTYIVDYIVEGTVGRLILDKAPSEIAHLRVLDPACGSGSFLLGAYDYLLKWHLKWYSENDPQSLAKVKNPPIYQSAIPDPTAPGPTWRLTSRERKRIALTHIFGVDLDEQAVEVTKLSLALKVLEGETAENIDLALKNHKERGLPDFADNIKCGNSLIGPDFYNSKDPKTWKRRNDLSDEERRRLNDFSWEKEFATVMKAGGFDVVIGNPPYSNYSARDSMRAFYEREFMPLELKVLNETINYCSQIYASCSVGTKDLYKWFFCKSLHLVKKGGHLGFITPNTWFTLTNYADVKKSLFESSGDIEIVDLGFGVFSVTVPTSLVILRRGVGNDKRYVDLKAAKDKETALDKPVFEKLSEDGKTVAHLLVEIYLNQWAKDSRLKNWMKIREGQHIERSQLSNGHEPQKTPIIDSKNMGRYKFDWEPKFCYRAGKGDNWKRSDGSRIVVRKTGDSIVATLTPVDESYVLQSLYQSVEITAPIATEFMLGLLNSTFLTFLYQNSEFGQKGRTLAQFRKGNLDLLPIPKLDFTNKTNKQQHDRMVQLVETMLQLQKDVRAASGNEKTRLEKRIELTDNQIDALVYELYSLSEAEIALVKAG